MSTDVDRFERLEQELERLKADRERERSNAAAVDEAQETLRMRQPKLPEWLEKKEQRLAREARERAEALADEDRRREAHLQAVEPHAAEIRVALVELEGRMSAARRRHADELTTMNREAIELSRELGELEKVPPSEEKTKPSKLKRLVGGGVN